MVCFVLIWVIFFGGKRKNYIMRIVKLSVVVKMRFLF